MITSLGFASINNINKKYYILYCLTDQMSLYDKKKYLK